MERVQEFLESVTVVDTETTDFKPEELATEIVEVAAGKFLNGNWNFQSQLVRPVRDIPPQASAIHHISNKMVRGLPIFDEQVDVITELLHLQDTKFMVAHNAAFDLQILENAYAKAFEFDKFKPFDEKTNWVCTWRLAKQILPFAREKGQSNLSYLRYRLDLDVPEDLPAHRAGADVYTCGRLLEKLIMVGIEDHKIKLDKDISEQVINLCWDSIKIDNWPFGKHAGKKLEDIPTDYYMWAVDNMDIFKENNPNYNADLSDSVAKVLETRL